MTELTAGTARSAEGGLLEKQPTRAGLSLLFAVGDRPSVPDIERLLKPSSDAGIDCRITHQPEDKGWLELLASGLTFDLTGLAPGDGCPLPGARHHFGTSPDVSGFPLEAITLVPGPHLEGGGAMMPVVRTMTGLAASLALPLQAKAVCWHPSCSWMDPKYFARVILNWLSGGAFPALGLTAVEQSGDGGVESVGLAFFTGQEVRVEASPAELPKETVKLAVRVIDYIIREGPLQSLHELHGPSGELLLAEPSSDGSQVRVWRGV